MVGVPLAISPLGMIFARLDSDFISGRCSYVALVRTGSTGEAQSNTGPLEIQLLPLREPPCVKSSPLLL